MKLLKLLKVIHTHVLVVEYCNHKLFSKNFIMLKITEVKNKKIKPPKKTK